MCHWWCYGAQTAHKLNKKRAGNKGAKKERREGKTDEMIEVWGKQGKKYKLRQPSLTLEDSWGDLGGLGRPDDRYWKILNETTKVQKKCTNSQHTHNNSPGYTRV